MEAVERKNTDLKIGYVPVPAETLVPGGDACKGQGTCAGQNVAAGDCVEVLCFHGKQRCATCIAIERNTREVLEKEFAFGNARKSPDTFKAGLVKTVSGMLK